MIFLEKYLQEKSVQIDLHTAKYSRQLNLLVNQIVCQVNLDNTAVKLD